METIEKNKPYDFPEAFTDFVMMPKFPADIDALAALAEPEDWDYKNTPSSHSHPILRNYINYTYRRIAEENTYRRIAEEKKISVTPDEENCCWNTGLITKTQEPIFALFAKNKLPNVPYWHFWKFARRGEWEFKPFRFASRNGSLLRRSLGSRFGYQKRIANQR